MNAELVPPITIDYNVEPHPDVQVEGSKPQEITLEFLGNPSYAAATLDQIADRIPIGTLGDARLRVRDPIVVRFSTEGEHIIAEAEELEEFGFGANWSVALRDLQHTLVELYFSLQRDRERLGPDLKSLWSVLQKKISPRP